MNTNDAKDSKQPNMDLVKEQYAQYYQMLRHHTGLSWQILSFTVVSSVVLFGLDSSRLESWSLNPLLPAICFLIISLFLIVMLVHHRRNGIYAGLHDAALVEIEQKYGFKTIVKVHHCQVEPEKSFLKRISSSKCLSIFLVILIIITLSISLYYFYLVFV